MRNLFFKKLKFILRLEESKVLLTFKTAIRKPELYMMAILSSFFSIAPIIVLANYKVLFLDLISSKKWLNLKFFF